MSSYIYAYGYRTREAAELAIIDELSESRVSRCENPRVVAYRTKDGRKLYSIILDSVV
jgi:hypothetical protein